MVPLLPSVTIFSATERAALALASVVVTRLCLIRLQTRLASIALRCCAGAAQFGGSFKVSHKVPITEATLVPVLPSAASSKSGSKFMPRDKTEACSLSLISLSDFLPKLRYLSISCFGLHRQLADGGDVGVVQAVGGADAQLDFVDAHVEQLLELGLLVVLLVDDFFELDGVLVVADEDIEMMLQNGGGLGQRVIRRDAAVGPDSRIKRS